MAIADAGLDARWEADTLNAAAEASAVSSWADQISAKALTQATGTKQPSLRKSVINGKSVVRFDGGDHLLTSTLENGRAASWTRSVVIKVPNIGGEPQIWAGGQTTFPEGIYTGRQGYGSSGKWSVGISAEGSFAISTTDLDDAFHVLTVEWDHTTQTARLFKDGTLDGSGTNSSNPTRASTTMVLGAEGVGGLSEWLTGDIAAVFQANRVLTTGERAAVHSHVQDTYAITVSDYTSGGVSATVAATDTITSAGVVAMFGSASINAVARIPNTRPGDGTTNAHVDMFDLL